MAGRDGFSAARLVAGGEAEVGREQAAGKGGRASKRRTGTAPAPTPAAQAKAVQPQLASHAGRFVHYKQLPRALANPSVRLSKPWNGGYYYCLC
jgi:hypothetical protein